MDKRFRALEYHSDQSFHPAAYEFHGSTERGWQVTRDGKAHLSLPPGYRLLRTDRCGVCSTDLDRHHLPFPLPQITGHELIGLDEEGRRYVVEINATRAACGVEEANLWTRAGLDTHDPERLVLGIHDLPGGFGPWILVPEHAAIEIPAEIADETAVLTEPFAAVLHAVHRLSLQPGDTVAVLGPRRLGLLAIAALAGARRGSSTAFEIEAWSRHESLGELAVELGADRARRVRPEGDGLVDVPVGEPAADVVLDTTGNPDALPTALGLARREVHLKSTHGRPSAGLANSTALVVDEISIARWDESTADPARHRTPLLADDERPVLAWLSSEAPTAELASHFEVRRGSSPSPMREEIRAAAGTERLPRADLAVVDDLAMADRVLRPSAEDEESLIRPRGTICLRRDTKDPAPLARAVAERGLRLSSSRCGDFRAALQLLASDPVLQRLGERFVTHRFPATALIEAFAQARRPDCIKAVVVHDDAGRGDDAQP